MDIMQKDHVSVHCLHGFGVGGICLLGLPVFGIQRPVHTAQAVSAHCLQHCLVHCAVRGSHQDRFHAGRLFDRIDRLADLLIQRITGELGQLHMAESMGSHFHTQIIFSLHDLRVVSRILSQAEEGGFRIILLQGIQHHVGGVRIGAVIECDGYHGLGWIDLGIDHQLKALGKAGAVRSLCGHGNGMLAAAFFRNQLAVLGYGNKAVLTAGPF